MLRIDSIDERVVLTSGVANTPVPLIALRVVAGCGGAMMLASTAAIVIDAFTVPLATAASLVVLQPERRFSTPPIVTSHVVVRCQAWG